MIKSKILIDKVNNKYFDLKAEKYAVKRYNDEILSANDEYVSLENKLGEVKFLLAKAEYLEDNAQIKKLSTEVEVYKKMIETLKNSLPLAPVKYECNLCKDTGILNGKRCKCYYKYLTNFALESLGVNEVKGGDFSKLIQSPALIKQFKVIKNYADNFPNTQINNLIFLGNVGTGKTELAKCVLSSVKKRGYIALFLTSTELNSIFIKMHTSEVDRNLIYDVLSEADLLIIDDLGTEPIYKNVTVEYLLSLVSNRIEKGKHLIITTNLNDLELSERYNERFTSRILDKSKSLYVPFISEDFRIK